MAEGGACSGGGLSHGLRAAECRLAGAGRQPQHSPDCRRLPGAREGKQVSLQHQIISSWWRGCYKHSFCKLHPAETRRIEADRVRPWRIDWVTALYSRHP